MPKREELSPYCKHYPLLWLDPLLEALHIHICYIGKKNGHFSIRVNDLLLKKKMKKKRTKATTLHSTEPSPPGQSIMEPTEPPPPHWCIMEPTEPSAPHQHCHRLRSHLTLSLFCSLGRTKSNFYQIIIPYGLQTIYPRIMYNSYGHQLQLCWFIYIIYNASE